MKKVKVLVLGASGMVGHVLSNRLHEFPELYEVITATRSKNSGNTDIVLDATNSKDVRSALEFIKPDVCINAIGVLNHAADELDIAHQLNTQLPLLLSELGKSMGFQLIHISTDCVFSGSRGGYVESDSTDATGNYGQTKIGGEGIDSDHLVIRTSVIGPEIRPQAIGLFHWFTSQSGEVRGYQHVIWSGVTTLTLSDAIMDAIEHKTRGLLHLVNNQPISKLALIQLIHQYFPNKYRQIIPSPVPVSDKSLISTRRDITFQVPPYEQMIQHYGNGWSGTQKIIRPIYNDPSCIRQRWF
jgi:dTDP-4-dehydrorhamnose reductase